MTDAPLILWGHSAGGQYNYEFACWKPDRVIAFIVNKGGFYYTALAPKATRNVPGLFYTGETQVSAVAEVRHAMVSLQRRLGAGGGVVLEGRDIGTVVFPQAEVKIFLVATARERGRRRCAELRAKGLDVDLDRTVAEVEARDAADCAREHAPLLQAADAVGIDTTGLGIDEVLAAMLALVQARQQGGQGAA